jgi:hypothetical protein
MKKTATILILLVLALGAAPASASAPLPVTIDSVMDLNTGTGTFAAFGPAVDAGLICPSGDVFDLGTMAMGYQSGILINLHMYKRLVCADGSGEIYLMLNVRILTSVSLSNWLVVDANGDYARLKGQGKITATGTGNLIYDHYTGALHND